MFSILLILFADCQRHKINIFIPYIYLMNETYMLSIGTAVANFRYAISHFFFFFFLQFITSNLWVATLIILPDLLVNLTAQCKLYFPYKILNELLGMIWDLSLCMTDLKHECAVLHQCSKAEVYVNNKWETSTKRWLTRETAKC